MENFRNQQKIQASNKATMENKPIKVKYISSPMMVKANNEFEFRAIVQKLTGQHSPDDAFYQSPQEFNHVFYPPPSTAAPSFDAKDRYSLVSGDVYDPVGVGVGVGEGRDWRGEMEGSLSGFQASYVDVWR